ncbi:MAG: DUF423 domain-containing protein [Asticcacaulis sp.]
MVRPDRLTAILLFLVAASGLMSVALGAFAAHGMSDPKAIDWLKTGSQYQITHALAALGSLAWGRLTPKQSLPRLAVVAFLIGASLFSGALYGLAFGGPRWLGMVAPLGGLTLMLGWTLLGLSAIRTFLRPSER